MKTRFTIARDVLASHLEGEAVLLHMGTRSYFRLNRTGAHVWKCIEEGADSDAIVQSLVNEFEVSRTDAEGALTTLRDDLVANKLISLTDSSASSSDA